MTWAATTNVPAIADALTFKRVLCGIDGSRAAFDAVAQVLIILGSRGRSGVHAVLSASERVEHAAPRSVLVRRC